MQACGRMSMASSVNIRPARKIGEIIKLISGSIVFAMKDATGVLTSFSTSGRFWEASYKRHLVIFLAAILTPWLSVFFVAHYAKV